MTADVNPCTLNLACVLVGTHQDLLGSYEAGRLLSRLDASVTGPPGARGSHGPGGGPKRRNPWWGSRQRRDRRNRRGGFPAEWSAGISSHQLRVPSSPSGQGARYSTLRMAPVGGICTISSDEGR